jgi:hypothetical protein
MDRELLAGDFIQMDEMSIRCNDPVEQDGKCRHATLVEILVAFRGVLQADGYEA